MDNYTLVPRYEVIVRYSFTNLDYFHFNRVIYGGGGEVISNQIITEYMSMEKYEELMKKAAELPYNGEGVYITDEMYNNLEKLKKESSE